jgi:hypothetical protein
VTRSFNFEKFYPLNKFFRISLLSSPPHAHGTVRTKRMTTTTTRDEEEERETRAKLAEMALKFHNKSYKS